MSRIDKYSGVGDGFRAPLAAAWAGQIAPIGVGLDVNGRIVPGAGNTGIEGVFCKPDAARAGSNQDVMKDGELTEFGGVPGTVYVADNVTGVISAAPAGGAIPAGTTKVGHTVEATRLIVGVGR